MNHPTGAARRPLIVLGYPTASDKARGEVCGGSTFLHLESMLRQVGVSIQDVDIINVTSERPDHYELAKSSWFCTKTTAGAKGYLQWGECYIPPHLFASFQKLRLEVLGRNPSVVIAMGEIPLLALACQKGITNWRGSHLQLENPEGAYIKVIPTFDPVILMKMYEWNFIATQDLRRAFREANTETYENKHIEKFHIHPTYEQTISTLNLLKETIESSESPFILSLDVETRHRHITHLGLAWSTEDAISIRLAALPGEASASVYTADQEVEIVSLIREIVVSQKVTCVGQNFTYDVQYLAREWGFIPHAWHDTMTAWHVVYLGLKKSLAFISSMVLPHYEYWKDSDCDVEPEYSIYNARDCVRTYEIWIHLRHLLNQTSQWPQYNEQVLAQRPNLMCMLRGVKQDIKNKGAMGLALMDAMAEREQYFIDLTDALTGGQALVKSKGAKPWYRSPTQQVKIFYEIFKLPVNRNRATGQPTTDDEALIKIGKAEPLFKPICDVLAEYRSLGVFLSTFIQCPLDWDNRIRSSFGVGMTETLRNTSSEDAFGFGGNLQNIPKGG